MHSFSMTVAAQKTIHHAHWEERAEKARRIYVMAEDQNDIAIFLERFVGKTVGEDKDPLIAYQDEKLEGIDDMIVVLKVAERFMGSVKIAGAVYVYLDNGEGENERFSLEQEWVVAREGAKERVLCNDQLGELGSSTGRNLADQILSFF